jgi:hypothetical protein
MTCLEQERAIAIDGTYMLVDRSVVGQSFTVNLLSQIRQFATVIAGSIVQLNSPHANILPTLGYYKTLSAFILWHSAWIRPLLIERILCHGLGKSLSCPIGLILVVKVRSLAWRNCEQEGMQAFPRLTRKHFNTQAMEPLSTSAATPWASYQKGLGHSCRKS